MVPLAYHILEIIGCLGPYRLPKSWQIGRDESLAMWLAGPEKMVQSVAIAACARNDTLGLSGTPYLDVKKYTYSL